jgi:YVTN family beta-propeller protein
VEFRILGPLQVLDGARELTLGSPKERQVLAVLLLHPGEIVSRQRLIEALWGESPPPTAGNALNVHVSQLRKRLARNGGDPVATRRPGYVLDIRPHELDAMRFQRLVTDARARLAAGEVEAASRVLGEALGLWRGPALDGVELEAAARNEVARLEELRLAARMDWIDCELSLGLHEQLIGELEALVAEHPLRERLRGQLMLALYRSGRQADALRCYREARETLVAELGIEPSKPLQRLERAILNQDRSLEAPAGVARAAAAHAARSQTRPPESAPGGGAVGAPREPRVSGRLVGLLALILAATVIGFVAFRAAEGDAPRVSQPSDAPAGRVTGRVRVPLPGGPFVGRLAFGAGSLWIRKGGANEVLRAGPVTNKVVARIRVGFSYDTGIVVRGGDVWVSNGEEGTVSRISAAINAVVATVPVGKYPLGIAATEHDVWVANHHSGTVSRIDPWRDRVASTVPISPPSQFSGPLAAVFADGNVWVADATLGEVIRIDPRRNRTNHVSETGPACGGMTVLGGSVWIASGCEQGVVTRIDTATARVTARIRVPGMAFDVAAGFGSIWATTLRGLLLRIDPATNQIRGRLQLPDAVAVTTGAGYVWVVDRESRSVLRIRPSD